MFSQKPHIIFFPINVDTFNPCRSKLYSTCCINADVFVGFMTFEFVKLSTFYFQAKQTAEPVTLKNAELKISGVKGLLTDTLSGNVHSPQNFIQPSPSTRLKIINGLMRLVTRAQHGNRKIVNFLRNFF